MKVSNLGAGAAEMHVRNLALEDYFDLPNARADGPEVDATVSFDVIWQGPVTRSVAAQDAAHGFTGNFFENQATITWSGSNELGFGFFANPGNAATSISAATTFAELGHERNGIFLPSPLGGPASPQDPVPQPPSAPQLQPVVPEAIASWQAAGASAAQIAVVANLLPVPSQTTPTPVGTSNPAPLPVPAAFVSQPLPLLAAESQSSAITFPLTPRLPASTRTLLDQVFTRVAAEPLDQVRFSDPLVS